MKQKWIVIAELEYEVEADSKEEAEEIITDSKDPRRFLIEGGITEVRLKAFQNDDGN
jgi:hypothetical protein